MFIYFRALNPALTWAQVFIWALLYSDKYGMYVYMYYIVGKIDGY